MSPAHANHVIQLPSTDVPRVVDVLAAAFRDYPVMRFVLGQSRDYERRLHTLIDFFVQARALRDEPMFGIADGTALGAAAIVSYPHRTSSPAALGALRDAVWQDLGADARARYEACGQAWSASVLHESHLHVNMIGVRPAMQGRGLAKRLLTHVHELSVRTPESMGITLTTEDPVNVRFYEHLGYRVVGHATIAPDLETWSMFRSDPAAAHMPS